MAPATPASHDPAMTHAAPAAPTSQPAQALAGLPATFSTADISNLQLNGLDQTQIMNLLRSLPGVFPKVSVSAQFCLRCLFLVPFLSTRRFEGTFVRIYLAYIN